MSDKLNHHQPSSEESRILSHLLAMQPHCHTDLFPRVIAALLAQDQGFLHFFRDPDNDGPVFEFVYRHYATVLHHHLGSLTHKNSNKDSLLFVPPACIILFSLFSIFSSYFSP